MSLKVVPPKDLELLEKTIEALENLVDTDTSVVDKEYHMQALKDLKEYKKSLNIKKIDCLTEQSIN